ncbi:Hypothetical protein PHPALM_14989 [Phytophthora palmivora]|uniref:Carbohydrate esterase n=1 Tax=Phytophthora palmivora TaxID=4796 RepID=A0A2P4XTJ2_9STRA|nr:Hypothetical protein PHPALM_14989 [Phytophthora palmivora]
MHLNGYNNTKTVLEWALNKFPDPEKLVIGGYSAGSLGAQLWSAKIAEMWHVEQKSVTYQVLADSYVDVFLEQKAAASSLLNFFGGCDVDLHFPELMQVECKAETATATALVDALIQEAPKSKWLFIHSNADQFYGNLSLILDSHALFTNVTRFNIDSDEHVWLKAPGYATTTSLGGALLGNVLSEWLGQPSTDPASPRNTTVQH